MDCFKNLHLAFSSFHNPVAFKITRIRMRMEDSITEFIFQVKPFGILNCVCLSVSLSVCPSACLCVFVFMPVDVLSMYLYVSVCV